MTGDIVSDELRSRVRSAGAHARRLLELEEPDPPVLDDVDAVARLIEAVEHRLTEETGWREAAAAHAEQIDRLDRRFGARAEALQGVEQAIARLREFTAPTAILLRAPQELCKASRLTRAVLSLVREGRMVPEAAHFAYDAAAASTALERLAAEPARLEHPLIEADVLRRRRATLVADASLQPRVHGPTARIMGWHGYVAAPILVRGDAVALIHADRGADGPALDVLDGDVVWAFARGLADVYETASLRRALRRQRDEMRDFVDWLSARSSELSDAPIELVAERPAPPDPPGRLDVIGTVATPDDRLAFEHLLTRRELDVLRLLARGKTNRAIAAELVISEATVKHHVIKLLRKLHVSNRAEAVARYHRVVRVRGEAP